MRKTRRVHDRLPLALTVEYEDFERFHPDRLMNLSAGGAFILTPKPFPLRRHICFKFTLPEIPGRSIRACGTVVWSPLSVPSGTGTRHPMGMGVEFDAVDENLFHLLDQYVTVSTGLKRVDPRIGNELPRHIRATLPDPIDEGVKVDLASEPDRPGSF